MKKISCMTQINEKFKMDGQDEGREDREACFKRLHKRRLGGSKKTDTGQNTGDLRVMEGSMLKTAIIWKMELTCESKMDFIIMQWKIQSHQFKADMLNELKMLMTSQC